MKQFLKPTLWKIILTILFALIAFFLWTLYLSFFDLSMCGLMLPGYQAKPQPFSSSEFIQQIPNVISENYNHCPPYQSESLQAAVILVEGIYFLSALILLYVLACEIVFLIHKVRNRMTETK